MDITVNCTVNGTGRTLTFDHQKRLIDVLRDDLRLTGTKEGCGVGECGACTVLMNGSTVNACLVAGGQMEGSEILTVEYLEKDPLGAKLQQSFISEGAIQCGYCIPGMLMSGYDLLQKNPNPTREEAQVSISGNLCRCTGYVPIVNAILHCAQDAGGKTDAD